MAIPPQLFPLFLTLSALFPAIANGKKCAHSCLRPLVDILYSTFMSVLTFLPLCSSEGLHTHTW